MTSNILPDKFSVIFPSYLTEFLKLHEHIGHNAILGEGESFHDENFKNLREKHTYFLLHKKRQVKSLPKCNEHEVPEEFQEFIKTQGQFEVTDSYGNTETALSIDGDLDSLLSIHGEYIDEIADNDAELYFLKNSITIGTLAECHDSYVLLGFTPKNEAKLATYTHDDSFNFVGEFSIFNLFKLFHKDLCQEFPALET